MSKKSGCVWTQPHSQVGFVCLLICFVNKEQCVVNNSLLSNYVSFMLLLLICLSRSLWPRVLRRGCAAARLLGFLFRIPERVWMFVSCECCVLSEVCASGWSFVQRSPYQVWCVQWVWWRSSGNGEPKTQNPAEAPKWEKLTCLLFLTLSFTFFMVSFNPYSLPPFSEYEGKPRNPKQL